MPTLFDDLTAGHHILADNGHEYLRLGHLTARGDETESLWIKPPAAALTDVTPTTMMLVSYDGSVICGSGEVHIEVPLHAEIYRRRPDVTAIVHTHAVEVAALTASTSPFRIVSQQSMFFAAGIGHYDRSHLVSTRERGEALADALGDKRASTLRNHGLVTVGRSVQEAVVLAVCFVNSLRVQLAAATLGDVVDMPEEDIADLSTGIERHYASRIDRIWQAMYDAL